MITAEKAKKMTEEAKFVSTSDLFKGIEDNARDGFNGIYLYKPLSPAQIYWLQRNGFTVKEASFFDHVFCGVKYEVTW